LIKIALRFLNVNEEEFIPHLVLIELGVSIIYSLWFELPIFYLTVDTDYQWFYNYGWLFMFYVITIYLVSLVAESATILVINIDRSHGYILNHIAGMIMFRLGFELRDYYFMFLDILRGRGNLVYENDIPVFDIDQIQDFAINITISNFDPNTTLQIQ
jgi:hypothetical protein